MSSRTRYRTFQLIRRRITAMAATADGLLDLAVTDLGHIDPLFLTAAQRMQDARAGLPGAQAYDAPTVAGSGADTGTHPERMSAQPDRTEPDRSLLDTLLHGLELTTRPGVTTVTDPTVYARTLTRTVLSLRRLIDAWTPHPALPSQQRAVREANVKATECALTREHLNLWAAVYRTTNLWGLLPEPLPVSRWLWDFTHQHRRLPTAMEWKHHASKDDDLRRQLIEPVTRSRR